MAVRDDSARTLTYILALSTLTMHLVQKLSTETLTVERMMKVISYFRYVVDLRILTFICRYIEEDVWSDSLMITEAF